MTTQSPANRISRPLGATLVAALAVATAQTASAQEPMMARVRSSHSAITALISEGRERSATFRRLVQTIDDSDGIVYIEEGQCHHGVRACLVLSVTPAGPNRILRVIVDTRKADWDLMGSIGHELQHTVEALSEPATIDSVGLSNFFCRIAPTDRHRFETMAAITAGDAVRNELRVRRPL